jgi:hypothetical protein
VAVTLIVIFVGLRWIASVALSYYTSKKVPPVARIVPVDLKDTSVSSAPGKKLSYFGYGFVVPWSDLDEAQTTLYPTDKPDKSRVVLHFRSGLQLAVSAMPARTWAAELASEFKVPQPRIESSFEAKSDYGFLKNLYEFTPKKMHYWAWSDRVHNREMMLLTIKSISLPGSADTGIFNIHNPSYRGFQVGNPQVRQNRILLDLFSDDGGVEMTFFEKDYRNPSGVTQPEINRIVDSLCKASPNEAVSAAVARK